MKPVKQLFLLLAVVLLGGCASSYRPPVVRARHIVPPELEQTFAPDQNPEPVRTVVAPVRRPQEEDRPQERSRGPESPAPDSPGMTVPTGAVTLDSVLQSVDRYYPELLIARLEIARTEGQILASQGAFDTMLSIDSKNKMTGFYQNNILDAAIEQPLQEGGVVLRSGYRFGLGDFGSYDGDIKTNDAGELFFGLEVPLLKGSAIDKRRAELFKARLRRDAADPLVQNVRVRLSQKASAVYWKCVAAAQKVQIARDLLTLARTRQSSLEETVNQGELPRIVLVDNGRLIASREDLVIAAIRDFEQAAISLSLFLRDTEGVMMRGALIDFPDFPAIPQIAPQSLESHIQFGLKFRPELRLIDYDLALADVEREKRRNDLLPKFNLSGLASQDLGSSTSPSSVDDEFEFGIGVKFEVPLARRVARGRLAETRAKISQLGQKARLQADKVESEIRDASSAYMRARERLAVTRRAADLAAQLEQAERDKFAEGASDLIRINLREQTAAKARSDVVNATALCFISLANYRAAMGLPEALRN